MAAQVRRCRKLSCAVAILLGCKATGRTAEPAGPTGDDTEEAREPSAGRGALGADPVARVQQLLQAGRLDEAWDVARRAVAEAPGDAERHFALGVVAQASGDLEGARRAFVRAAELDPKMAPAHAAVGAIDLEDGRPKDAVEAFSRALTLDPNLTEARYNRGLAHAALGDLSAAAKDLEQAAAKAPKDPDVALAVADVRLRTGDPDAARKEAARAVTLAPRDPFVRRAAAGIFAAAGDLDEAVAHLEAAARIAPDDPSVRLALARVLVRRGRTGDLSRAVDLLEGGAKSPDAWVTLGTARAKLGKPQGALAAFDAALAQDPNRVDARVRRVGALAALGRCREARLAVKEIAASGASDRAVETARKAAETCKARGRP